MRASPLRRAAGRRNRSARPGPGAAPGQESSGHVPPRAVTTAPVSIRPGRRVIFKLRPWPDFSVDAMLRLIKLMISGSESVGPGPSQTRTGPTAQLSESESQPGAGRRLRQGRSRSLTRITRPRWRVAIGQSVPCRNGTRELDLERRPRSRVTGTVTAHHDGAAAAADSESES